VEQTDLNPEYPEFAIGDYPPLPVQQYSFAHEPMEDALNRALDEAIRYPWHRKFISDALMDRIQDYVSDTMESSRVEEGWT
jgi:hypothetical protein